MPLDVGNGRITTMERSGAVHHRTRALVLPAKGTDGAVADGTYVLLVEEPAPTLLALRPIPTLSR
jgi:hypothetical protein